MAKYIDAYDVLGVLICNWNKYEDAYDAIQASIDEMKEMPAADVVERSKVRQVLLDEFGKDEEEAIDALMETIDG